ncbi:auxin-responsive protein SAUR36-like [Dioscorea cayenensis subsp. rotundata]|uniref:Auxin-responsive protein SAUR36-like n=1 Tax=Dioscorea cayennensis subsp. rotundata TaxID=55577 RepID=A0AB40BH60_DIOCR|nr:auxin-responsive protein SAUR36-like [Dioscorea cayenensis subsp. rotundata]
MARNLLKIPSLKIMIPSPRADKLSDFNECSTSYVVKKGHFFLRTSKGKLFMVPLAYLNNNTFKELLKISEEDFGFLGGGPFTLPCNATSMEFVLSMIRRGVSQEVERALLCSISISCQSSVLLLLLNIGNN